MLNHLLITVTCINCLKNISEINQKIAEMGGGFITF